MKPLLYKILVYILVLLSAVSCRREDPPIKIGVAQCSSDDWRTKMNNEIMREAMFHNNVKVEIRSADDDNARQIADIQYFIDNKFDIIIVAPNEAEAITPIIKKAYDNGIPVITFDRDIIGDSYTAHIEVDNYGLGASAARFAASMTHGPLRVFEIQGSPNMSPTTRRHKGFVDELKGFADKTVIGSPYGNWDPARAAALMDSVLNTGTVPDLVYAHNDRMAIAAAEVAAKRGQHNIKFIGIDGSPNIGIRAVKDGLLDATFLYPTDGDVLLNMALNILQGKPYEKVIRLAPLSPVDASNADILLRQSELQDNQTHKIQLLQSKIDEYWNKHAAQTSLLYAVLCLFIVMGCFFVVLYRMYWQHKRHKNALERQNDLLQTERDKQAELYKQLDTAVQSKLMFFTNVSHDLRTPLTLISEPVGQVLDRPDMSPAERETMMRLAQKNVKVLQRLIDQILDFRKYENGQLELKLNEADIFVLVRDWLDSFSSLARSRRIKLTLDLPSEPCSMALDIEKMQSVFFNLLSNAFKYTPDGGRIQVNGTIKDNAITLSISDNGAGIPASDIERIFERFYKVDRIQPQGSGIGLAIVKAFVELHGGKVGVESAVPGGTTFTLSLPVKHVEGVSTAEVGSGTFSEELAVIENIEPGADKSKPLLLVIDDNPDIRQLVTAILQDEYNIIQASNGRSGVRLAAKYTPDIIISDVMMPEMDGLECCRTIKNELSTSHIPVLLLTACSLDEQRARGYASGADGYLSKPFNAQVLASRCRNLIENRKRIKDMYSRTAVATPAVEHPAKTSEGGRIPTDIDSDFYARFVELVHEHMSDADMTIDMLASAMNLGKSQFTRKIKALTNHTPVDIIRTMRLQRARTLLLTSDHTISEICYEVGFSQPAYFTKCYRDAFGQTPTELRASVGK